MLLMSTGACNSDDITVVTPSSASVLETPAEGTVFVLDETEADEVAVTFKWSDAQYQGAPIVVNYELEIAKSGTDFKNPIILSVSPDNMQAITVSELNTAAMNSGLTPFDPQDADVRIKSYLGEGGNVQYSNVIKLTITPYAGLVTYEFTDWYLIGAAVDGGWDNNVDTNHQPMFRDGTDATQYKFTGFFKAGNFKLISEKGSWASQLGRSGEGTIEIKDNAGEFTIAADGYYTLKFNTQSLKYTLEAFDGAAAPTYSTVGIIGSSTAGGWDASTALVKSGFNAHAWSLGVTSLKEGEAKFRANNAWDVSWGGKTPFSGGGAGDNIPVAESKYVIYFNDLDGSYLMIPNQ